MKVNENDVKLLQFVCGRMHIDIHCIVTLSPPPSPYTPTHTTHEEKHTSHRSQSSNDVVVCEALIVCVIAEHRPITGAQKECHSALRVS